MRQGPNYRMWVDTDSDGKLFLLVPLELSDEWLNYKTVTWVEQKDGTIILKPHAS